MSDYISLDPPKNYKALLDPAVMQQWERKFTDAEKQNQQLYRQKVNAHQKLIADAITLYGSKHKVIRYLRENQPAAPRSLSKLLKSIQETVARLKSTEETRRRRQETKRLKQEQEEREAEERRAANLVKYRRRQTRLDEVTAQLIQAGYVLNEDFKRRDATKFMKAHREWIKDEETGRHRAVIIPKVTLPAREELAFPVLEHLV